VHIFDAFGEKPVQLFPCFVDPTRGEQICKTLQVSLEFGLLGFIEAFARFENDAEYINDLSRHSPGRAASCEGINVALTDVQTEGRQESAKNGELRKIIEAHDHDVELTGPGFRTARYTDVDTVFCVEFR